MTREELKAVGCNLSAEVHARLAAFVALLQEENKHLNLTAARDDAQLWRRHICDSLAALPLLREHGVRRLLDLGSGGGLPGIPLACACPDVQVTLLDATRKKVGALQRIVTQLGLRNTETVSGRAETHAHEPAYREQFDAVTVRAVAALQVLIEYAAGFVRPGGQAWFFKTADGLEDEQAAAEPGARTCRLEYAGVTRYRLPGETRERVLVLYRKVGALDPDLPRRAGRASKRPLR